jgi:hypothetical protein
MLCRSLRAISILTALVFSFCPGGATAFSIDEPAILAGLSDDDPLVRIATIETVAREKSTAAISKLAALLQSDPYSDVRVAACEALGQLQATSQLELLATVAAGDANAAVRSAASRAIDVIRDQDAQKKDADKSAPLLVRESYRMPELIDDEPAPQARTFGFGIGGMGAYGLAALDIRFRIATGGELLPYVGIEFGGGWTPPGAYQLIAGRIDDVTDPSNKWKIVHGGAAVLLYLHRDHYVPLRGAFDIGQGPNGSVGYGYEQLNVEGFFSWGFEVGMLFHPVMSKWIGNLVDCDAEAAKCSRNDLWPVVPYVRFTLHFYLM